MIFYYDDFGNIFHNRFEAIVSPHPCYFYFYDKEFSQANWRLEPTQSLQQLYKERAEWIRDNYEYVILAFSGGADSTNVLESFYYNNIHIDEILCVGAFSQPEIGGTDKNLCEDFHQNGFPLLKSLSLANTKITVEDYTTLFNDVNNFDIIKNHGIEWYKHVGSYYSMHNWYWNNLPQKYRFDKKTAIVFGLDVPLLSKTENKFHFHFSDYQIMSYGNLPYSGNFQRVNFYSDPRCINLIKKQLFLMLHSYKHFQENNYFDPLSQVSKCLKRILYKNRNPLNYQSKKSKSNLLSIRDMYILEKKDSDIYKIYHDGLIDFQKKCQFRLENTRYFRTKSYAVA